MYDNHELSYIASEIFAFGWSCFDASVQSNSKILRQERIFYSNHSGFFNIWSIQFIRLYLNSRLQIWNLFLIINALPDLEFSKTFCEFWDFCKFCNGFFWILLPPFSQCLPALTLLKTIIHINICSLHYAMFSNWDSTTKST